ncbi:hypothetical protein [Streptomyces thermodiastaticus]|uniref:hypothetical protein n=1 Tax=Streptomyces thermodiastaticus TaxID=44061 RepID=UPI00167B7DEC|nr:hypothetical protein [Streptomyces thermodiastaticus]MCE7549167.1 hypothetical protein [Streptomyces thermodiastaticus]GHF60653.1 hypothetical protein GCM10018787_06030 [Streptomyces thermodiastaticus]
MVFEPFRTARLTENEMSSPIEFVVLLGAQQTFLRTIAHFEPGVVLGGAPPTFFIKAGLGDPTPVEEGAEPVDIPGSSGTPVATAECHRTAEDIDTYLVTIHHGAPSGPWLLQIRNNDPEALEFAGFISHDEDETRQPWAEFAQQRRLEGSETESFHSIPVRNVGTERLTIADLTGSQLGGESSPCIIHARPESIDPHDVGGITVLCDPLRPGRSEHSRRFTHTFDTNDVDLAHARVVFEVASPVFPTMCLFFGGCGAKCKRFSPRMPPDEFQCATCFHDAGFHGLKSNPDDTPF